MSTHSAPSYLLQTPKGYFFRIRVPVALQTILKKRELKRAIPVGARGLAERQAIIYAAAALRLFDSLMKEHGMSDFTRFDMVVVRRDGARFELDPRRTEEELDLLLKKRLIDPADVLPAVVPAVAQSTAQPETLKEAVGAAVEAAVGAALHTHQTHTSPPTSGSRQIHPDMLLSHACELYLKNREGELVEPKELIKFRANAKPALESLFLDLMDVIGDRPINTIDHDEACRFREVYKLLPKTRPLQKKKDGPRLSVHELVAQKAARKVGANTVSQRISSISSVFNWLKLKNPAIYNPFFRVGVKDKAKKMNKRRPFDNSDLKKLFADQTWTELKFARTWIYWLPLLILYTGARVGELCQLEKKDFLYVGDIWCMSINDDPTKDEPEDVWGECVKSLKSENAYRIIPIHQMLISLGLKRFIDSCGSRVFPDIEPVRAKIAHKPCRAFNEKILVEADVKVPEVKTFYSFRHTMLDHLKQKLVDREMRAQIAGHALNDVTADVYGKEYVAKTMYEIVAMLDFDESMSQVKPWPEKVMLQKRSEKKKAVAVEA